MKNTTFNIEQDKLISKENDTNSYIGELTPITFQNVNIDRFIKDDCSK